MNRSLERNTYEPPSVERRRIVLTLVVCILACGAWHAFKSTLVLSVAKSSLGYDWRTRLIKAAFEQKGLPSKRGSSIHCRDSANPSWCVITEQIELESPQELQHSVFACNTLILDGDFAIKGKCLLDQNAQVYYPKYWASPIALDSEGHWLLRVELAVIRADTAWSHVYHAVIRLHEDYNELIWLSMVDWDALNNAKMLVLPSWEDSDGDENPELVYRKAIWALNPNGMASYKPTEALAVFEMCNSTGLLETRLLKDGFDLVPWTPLANAPIRIEQNEKLGDTFRELMPPPDED